MSQLYTELARVAKAYYKDANFCAPLAISVATGRKFGKVRSVLARLGRKHGRGTEMAITARALNVLGYALVFDAESTRRLFDKTVPKATAHLHSGIYLVLVNRHILCVRDGICHDWTATRRHKVKGVYRVYPIPAVL